MATAEEKKLRALESQMAQLLHDQNEKLKIEKESPRDKQAREQRVQTQQALLATLAELGGKLFNDDDITFYGDKLVIPENMSLTQASTFLQKKEEEMERETNFSRTFMYRPWDGAYCMWNVMKRHFGAVGHRDTIRYTMFGKVKEAPQMVSIPTDVGKKEQVPWGTFELPFLEGVTFQTGGTRSEYGMLFQLTATGPKKYRFEIEGIFNLIDQELAENSLYRGKAFDGQEMPEFVDVYSVDRTRVVYSEEVMRQLNANVWVQLRNTDECERIGIPLKRAVLIHGPFGTGKTLAAMLTGQEAVENNWTFIKARPGRDNLGEVLQTARLYQPAVVFYEDLDAVASPVEDDDRQTITRLLDDFDGIEAKGTKILCVLTTNYPERIHKGMARPGRLDAMIEINELDQRGVELLVKVRIPEETLDANIDWSLVYEDARDYKPAFVTEFADRALRYLLVESGGTVDGHKITTEHLCGAARGLRPQFNKMQDAKDSADSDSLSAALGRRVESVIRETLVEDILTDSSSVA